MSNKIVKIDKTHALNNAITRVKICYDMLRSAPDHKKAKMEKECEIALIKINQLCKEVFSNS